MEEKQLPKEFRNLPEGLEGSWTDVGIKIYNKRINKSMTVFYKPRYIWDGYERLKIYGKIVDHNENGGPTKVIMEDQLKTIYRNLKIIKEKI